MLFNLYLISILYTNTMGLIIINRCNPIIKKEYERMGYKVKDKNDTDFVIDILLTSAKFLIPGYYLKKALKMTGKDFNIEKIIEEKINNGEIEGEKDIIDESIFRDDRSNKAASLSITPYRSHNNSMYTKERYPNKEEVDMEFWEDESIALTPYEEINEPVVKKDPLYDHFNQMSEVELEKKYQEVKECFEEFEKIKRLKKERDNLLNNIAA